MSGNLLHRTAIALVLLVWGCGPSTTFQKAEEGENVAPPAGSVDQSPQPTPPLYPSPTPYPSPFPNPQPSPQPLQPLPPANLSMGTGGRTGYVEENFQASNGLRADWRTDVPTDIGPQRPYGLTIHLHGDGGGDYDWLYRDNVRIGRLHNLIGIVVKAPNLQRRWYNSGERNAVFLHELIQNSILRKYNIDKRRIYFSGVSGGSQFLTGQFLPLYGADYNSGAVLLCGGPENWLNHIRTTPEFISNFRFYWYTHSGDFLYSQVREGIAYYQGRGFKVDSEVIPGGSHCDFNEGIGGALEKKLPLVLH